MPTIKPEQIKAHLDSLSPEDRALALTRASLALPKVPLGASPLGPTVSSRPRSLVPCAGLSTARAIPAFTSRHSQASRMPR